MYDESLPEKKSQKCPNLPQHESLQTGGHLRSADTSLMLVSFLRCSGERTITYIQNITESMMYLIGNVPCANCRPRSKFWGKMFHFQKCKAAIIHFFTLCRYASYYMINCWYEDYCKIGNWIIWDISARREWIIPIIPIIEASESPFDDLPPKWQLITINWSLRKAKRSDFEGSTEGQYVVLSWVGYQWIIHSSMELERTISVVNGIPVRWTGWKNGSKPQSVSPDFDPAPFSGIFVHHLVDVYIFKQSADG